MDDDDFFNDSFETGHQHHGTDAMQAGLGYAFYRHGQDQQTAQLVDAINDSRVQVTINHPDQDDPTASFVNALDFSTTDMPTSWDEYIGQEPLKRQIMVYLQSAKARGARFPHCLLASGFPGVGKTTMARLIAKAMGVKIIELVPPFNIFTLVDAATQLDDGDILFIDEIHKLADNGKRGAELLLKVLEDHVAFMPTGDVVELADITVIGATTDRDKLPEPVIDRFKAKPFFQAYTVPELAEIAVTFAHRHEALALVDDEMCAAIGMACRGTPRITEEMVMAARDLSYALGRPPTPDEMLSFIETEPDGLNRQHIQYITSLRQFFPRTIRDTEEIEYVIGEAAIQQILRETKQGLGRIENFLLERGLIDRTPRGRRLTTDGIVRAEQFIAQGKGATSAN